MNVIEEYQEEAVKKLNRQIVINFLTKFPGCFSIKQISEVVGVSIYFVRKIKKELQAKK